jgi:hypothetical protein
MVYSESQKRASLKYQRKLRAMGLYKENRNKPETLQKYKEQYYAESAIVCVKRLFGTCHLI